MPTVTGQTGGETMRYVCSNGNHRGTCDLNITKQAELLNVVLQAVRDRFVEGDAIGRLRAELRRQVEVSTVTDDADADGNGSGGC